MLQRNEKLEKRLREIIAECDAVSAKSAAIGNELQVIPELPRLKIDLDIPPACLDTREGLAAFRAMLPSVRVVFRAGGWGRLAPLARLWLAYCLCRAVPALNVRESWKLVRAK